MKRNTRLNSMITRFPALLAAAFVLYLVGTAYIAAAADPTIVYVAGVLIHAIGGIALALAFILLLISNRALRRTLLLSGVTLLTAAGVGVYLAAVGNTSDKLTVLLVHIAVGVIGCLWLLVAVWRRVRAGDALWARFRNAMVTACLAMAVLPAASVIGSRLTTNPADRIRNPRIAPASMQHEGGGPDSPFFPSSARTTVGGIIPSNFFMDSAACGECHQDIYKQWKSSVHHFASFNNQFYRKSIEYMQDIVGTEPSKWCAGCHDHAVFFNGRFERPIKEQIDTPEAHAGLACVSCHSIVHVDSSMGNGGFTIEYPPLHELASSRNSLVRSLTKAFTYLDPEPHRRSFMKPFMRKDSAEDRSTCHKVHLDVPVNKYRWLRGFNDYDSWQASGVSGQGARSFYYPPKSSTCTDCHMPAVTSNDPAAKNGHIRSHRFAAANTAVPFVNHDKEQLDATTRFLTSGFVSVDIFAVTPIEETGAPMVRRANEGVAAMTMFSVGEEADQATPVTLRQIGLVAAPIDRAAPELTRGTTVRIDVVVRTRKIGHFFPGGTVDAFDVWLELEARDANSKVFFWSGKVDDEGRGPVEPGAHFYRSYLLDEQGNPINKRNAWQARSLLYSRLIPPGAADVAHFRLRIPDDAVGPVTVTAKLNHRKFSSYYSQFVYAGRPKPGQPLTLVSPSFNSLEYSFDKSGIPANVSGRIKSDIPVMPIITLARATATLPVGDRRTGANWAPVLSREDRERWNDWGIGLLLQGDLKGADYAFRTVTQVDRSYADGWLNVARALIQEGQMNAAHPYLEEALRLNPALARIHYFRSLVQKASGDYDAALASLTRVLAESPRDRVVLNQMARILFLKRLFTEALAVLQKVCEIDPEDVQMHYTMMLAYRGLGDIKQAAREEQLFRRFKADEASQAITATRRMISPEDNNERQPIHDHESVRLGGGSR